MLWLALFRSKIGKHRTFLKNFLIWKIHKLRIVEGPSIIAALFSSFVRCDTEPRAISALRNILIVQKLFLSKQKYCVYFWQSIFRHAAEADHTVWLLPINVCLCACLTIKWFFCKNQSKLPERIYFSLFIPMD